MVDELLDETKAGIVAPTIYDTANVLKELYHEYKSKGEIAYRGDGAEIDKYSHREMARKFSQILTHLASENAKSVYP